MTVVPHAPSQALLIPIFVLTYLGIAATRVPFLRIDRPAVALIGALALVLTGLLSLGEAFAFVNWHVIAFLLGMMVMVAYFETAGFFAAAARFLLATASTPRWLLWSTLGGCALLSAFFVNDTICLLLTPILIRATRAAGLPPLPYLVAIATSSNIGSALTVTGNPQNMLIGFDSKIPFATFSLAMAVPVVVALALDGLLISFVWRAALAKRPLAAGLVPAETFDRVLCAKALLALTVTLVLFVVEPGFYPQAALIGAALCLLTGRVPARDVWRRVDWSLLLFFAGLFVVMGGFQRAGYLDELVRSVRSGLDGGGGPSHGLPTFLALSGLAALLSNVVSNVPAVVLLEPLVRDLGSGRGLWLCLALASTLAGNFTLIASVANLIVAEKAAADGERLPFGRYLVIGLPISLVTVALGTAWIWATAG